MFRLPSKGVGNMELNRRTAHPEARGYGEAPTDVGERGLSQEHEGKAQWISLVRLRDLN